MNVEIGTESVQFTSWEHINGIFFAVQSSIAWPRPIGNLHFARWQWQCERDFLSGRFFNTKFFSKVCLAISALFPYFTTLPNYRIHFFCFKRWNIFTTSFLSLFTEAGCWRNFCRNFAWLSFFYLHFLWSLFLLSGRCSRRGRLWRSLPAPAIIRIDISSWYVVLGF